MSLFSLNDLEQKPSEEEFRWHREPGYLGHAMRLTKELYWQPWKTKVLSDRVRLGWRGKEGR
jgi:hypothetical protein